MRFSFGLILISILFAHAVNAQEGEVSSASPQADQVVASKLPYAESTVDQRTWVKGRMSDALAEQGLSSVMVEGCMKTITFSPIPEEGGYMGVNENGGANFSTLFQLDIWIEASKKIKARGEAYDPRSAFHKVSKSKCRAALLGAMKSSHDDITAYLKPAS